MLNFIPRLTNKGAVGSKLLEGTKAVAVRYCRTVTSVEGTDEHPAPCLALDIIQDKISQNLLHVATSQNVQMLIF